MADPKWICFAKPVWDPLAEGAHIVGGDALVFRMALMAVNAGKTLADEYDPVTLTGCQTKRVQYIKMNKAWAQPSWRRN